MEEKKTEQLSNLRPELRTRPHRNTGCCLVQCLLLLLFMVVEAASLSAFGLFFTAQHQANESCVLFAELHNETLLPGKGGYCSVVVWGEVSIAVLAGGFTVLIFLKQALGASG